MQVPLTSAVIALAVMLGPASIPAEARNRYRVERIYKLPLPRAETCPIARLWRHRDKTSDPCLETRDRRGTPTAVGINSVVTSDGQHCIVTLFSVTDCVD